ncbi:MAG: hypothetical protein JXD23_13885 [Spirochaetales bacterium]|nr:hypothetical protein [Spirochaetales bacterium]
MKVLIFGRGRIAIERYAKYLPTALERAESAEELEILWIDRNKKDCIDVSNWETRVPVREIKKILILSPPDAHFSNFKSVVKACLSLSAPFPDVYVEKPIYLESEEESWLDILAADPGLEKRVFYIDHYRFKDSLDFFLERKREILDAIGPIREIAFVSLEKEPFWDSAAFRRGYFAEHGCHFFGMLDRLFPEIGRCGFSPFQASGWKRWEQAGRPQNCGEDSAVLLSLKLDGARDPSFSKFEKAVLIIGKGLTDKKAFCVKGEHGACRLYYNENRNFVVSSRFAETAPRPDAKDSYARVAENIFPLPDDPIFLLPVKRGIADQEKVIALGKRFTGPMGRYNPGAVPAEIKHELERLGV